MSKLFKGIAVICLTCILYVSCKHEIPLPFGTGGDGGGSVIPPATPICSPDSVYFQNVVLPILNSNCAMSGCHDALAHKEGLVLNSYAGIMRIVQAGNANSSKLVNVITTTNPGDRMPPPPKAPLTAQQIDAIKKWINQGAKNNFCASCDTSSFTYNMAVKQIIQNKCVGCHTGTAAGGGFDLSTYNGLKIVVLNGKLVGSINHRAGFVAMPPAGTKLPDCELKQIQKWVDAGALNN